MLTDKAEIANIAATEQSLDLLDMLAGVSGQLRQNVRIAGGGKCRNISDCRLVQLALDACYVLAEYRACAWHDAAFGEVLQALTQAVVFQVGIH